MTSQREMPSKLKAHEKEKMEIEELKRRIEEMKPARGTQPSDIDSFDAFPFSAPTKQGLRVCKFAKPTSIQIGAIPHALAGRDLLAAAKTGSGKTLAFLLPMLELLYRNQWGVEDGLGALVISPTRELALQIFEVLRTIGKAHSFSAGLVIGGKNFVEEQYRLVRMNILVCTPGRLLQHMEQTPNFDTSNLQLLILDEADRILDMGFSKQLTAILSYLPTERQTMLFSATQHKSVKDLAKLSLKEPEYIAVHEKSTQATPVGLAQHYVVCDLSNKLDVLFNFIKSHLKQKMIVFLSTCRQTRFVYDVFCKLQPGIPLCALHGKYKQGKRVEIYYEFLNKPAAVMFATDIAARGLDFPQVDWVFQLDCPEDAVSYIHRVGRTARLNKNGKALLCLLPSELEGMQKLLGEAKIPIKEIKINPKKNTMTVQKRISSLVAADTQLKLSAQKAFMSYVRSVHLQPNQDIFQAEQLPLQEFASSLGLATLPNLQFLKESKKASREDLRNKKNVNRKLQQLKDKIKRAKEEKKRKALEVDDAEDDDAEEDDLMVVKQRHEWDKLDRDEVMEAETELQKQKQKQKIKRIRVDGAAQVNNKKLLFDEDGNGQRPFENLAVRSAETQDIESVAKQSAEFVEQVKNRLAEKDATDRELEKQRVRAKHTKKRLKRKGEREVDNDEDGADQGVHLGGSSSGDEEGCEDDDCDDEYSEDDGEVVANQEEMVLKMLQSRG